MITEFCVKNYKALRDVSLKLTPLHVLIGPNDSGKTSVLETVAALCKSVAMPLAQIFPPTLTPSDLLWDGTRSEAVFLGCNLVDGTLEGRYSFDCQLASAASADRFFSRNETWTPTGKPASIMQAIPYSTCVHSTVSARAGPIDLGLASALHGGLGGVAFFRWNPRMLRLPVVLDASHRLTIDSSGFGLAQCLDDILGLDRERFHHLEQQFASIFPEIKSIQLVSEVAYQWPSPQRVGVLPHASSSSGKGIYFQLRSGRSISAAQASDGLLLTLAYLTLLHSPQAPRVILVEEPENGVHPKRLHDVLGILRELLAKQTRTQIVLTTHSPYLLDLFKPEEVTLCKKEPDGAVSLHPLGDVEEVRRQLKVFSLGEIWTAEGDDALAKSTTTEVS